MPIYQISDIIGWEDSNGLILCAECFHKKFPNDYPSEWYPIINDETGEFLFECEDKNCKRRFTD